ncbi:hypothetical protein [Streptomyces sp. GC420]|uniref:hypothetical protein n=1 Tax=Streptomyces sp. GC420 TaxID=2697568 RepID=UPI0014150825|nr:hypothetical protein [Streptomyces sp. GC420]NBM19759.1 hypothetical protein [Streptomyces sp. GC420]
MTGQQHGRRTAIAALATISAMTAMTTTACSGSGAAAQAESRGDPAPIATIRNAPDVLVRTGSSKTRTSMEMATGGTRVTITGDGGYDYARRLGKLRVILPPDPSGTPEHHPITELLAPGALYMKNRGAGVPDDKWVRVDTTTLPDGNLVTGGATDPVSAAELLRGARRVTYLGETELPELPGTRLRHYRGTADMGRAAKAAPVHARGALAAAAKGFAKSTVPFEAYLDEQGRIRKVRHRFSFANGQDDRMVAVASTTLYYDFGVPVRVRLPASEDIFAGRIAMS